MNDLVRIEHIDPKYKNWIRIEWNIGKRCNFDCSYCPPDLHDNSSRHTDLEKFENTVRIIRETYPDKKLRISLTGGEPFVHPQILDILEIFPKYKIDEVSTITNGSLPLRKYQRALDFVDNLIFSWHYEHLRTDHMKEVLSNITKDKIHVHLMFLPGRLAEIKETVTWLTDNKIRFNVRRIRPLFNPTGGFNLPGSSGMAGQHKPSIIAAGPDDASANGYYSQEELEYLDSFVKAGTNYDNAIFFTTETSWTDNVNTLLKNRWNSFIGWKCMVGIETLYIENDGKIYRATCKQGGPIGTIEDGFTLPTKPIECRKAWCNCAADLNVTKWKNNE